IFVPQCLYFTGPVDKVSAFFIDIYGIKLTKFIEKLRILSEDTNSKFDEDKHGHRNKIESESQNSSSAFDDSGLEYTSSDTDESYSDESISNEIEDNYDLDYNLSKKDPHDAIPETTKLKLSTG
ncbi:1836_t:CDS:2, partial [Acaulospora morrowiae]